MMSPLFVRDASDVRVLVQNAQTAEYYSRDSGWTVDPDRARDFFSAFEAQDFCAGSHGRWQVVFHSERPAMAD